MKRIYEADVKDKSKLMSVLEADPYSNDSLSRIGYTVRDGSTLGEDSNKIYVYISAPDDKIKVADEKLKDVAHVLSGEVADRIIKKIEEEEANANAGFGNIFG